MNKTDGRLRWEDSLWEGAVLVASSRSGVTENVRLSDGTLVEVYHCKSGRVDCQEVRTIDDSLTVRPRQTRQAEDVRLSDGTLVASSDYLRMHGHPIYWGDRRK